MGYILKFLIFFVAIWVVISFIKKLASPNNQGEDADSKDQPEAMIQCAFCGVYTPHPKTSSKTGKVICSECQKQDKRS